MVTLLLPTLGACEGWPVYASLPVDSVDRLEAGVDTPGATVRWTQLPSPAEDGSDDDPRGMSAETLAEGRGNWFEGRLSGSGWDPTAVPAVWEDCGDTAQFPPYPNGDYQGDQDWRVIDVQTGGVLCNWFRFAEPGGQADVLAYPVNDCNLPTTPFQDGSGVVLGYNVAGQTNTWAYSLGGPQRIALVAVAWAPNDTSRSLVYDWGVSVLSASEMDGDGVSCPAPPGSG